MSTPVLCATPLCVFKAKAPARVCTLHTAEFTASKYGQKLRELAGDFRVSRDGIRQFQQDLFDAWLSDEFAAHAKSAQEKQQRTVTNMAAYRFAKAERLG